MRVAFGIVVALTAMNWVPSTQAITPASPKQETEWNEILFHRIHLKNGNLIDGQLLKDTPEGVTLKLKIGEMTIRRDQVDRVEFVKIRSIKEPTQVIHTPPRPHEPTVPAESLYVPPLPSPSDVVTLDDLPKPEGVLDEHRKRVDQLISLWTNASPNHRPEISREILKLGRDIVPYLSLILQKRLAHVPVRAISTVIGRWGDDRGIVGLASALKARDPDDRAAAVEALINIGKPVCVNHILSALDDESSEVWKPAGNHLIELYRQGKLPNLVDLLISSMARAQSKLAHAITLGRLDIPESRARLLELLSSGDNTVKQLAIQGLAENIHPEEAPEVLPLLSHGTNRALRQEACIYLGRARHRPAVPELIGMLEENDPGLAGNALRALREITGEKLGPDPDAWRNWYETSDIKKELEK